MTTVNPLPLFAWARRGDPDTSRRAASSVNPTALEAKVFGALKSNPSGLTSFEIADVLRLHLVTVSPRLRPLVNRGLVEDSGQRRIGASGRKQTVWRVKR
jgi:predicted ArsR family transcriptional regulator